MQPQVFDIQHREASDLEQLDDLAQAGRVRAGEDVLVGPGINRSRHIAADAVNQAASVGRQHSVHHSAEVRQILATNVLQHADRNERVESASDVAVVVFDELDAMAQPFRLSTLASVCQLLAREVEGLDFDSVLASHVQR